MIPTSQLSKPSQSRVLHQAARTDLVNVVSHVHTAMVRALWFSEMTVLMIAQRLTCSWLSGASHQQFDKFAEFGKSECVLDLLSGIRRLLAFGVAVPRFPSSNTKFWPCRQCGRRTSAPNCCGRLSFRQFSRRTYQDLNIASLNLGGGIRPFVP